MEVIILVSIVSIDGTKYNGVRAVTIKRKADFLDKYAERTEDGVLHRELIGVYYNWSVVFGWSKEDPEAYDRFWDALSAPKEFHTITMPYGNNSTYTFEGYCSSIADDMMVTRNGIHYWKGLTANFIAKNPARAGGG